MPGNAVTGDSGSSRGPPRRMPLAPTPTLRYVAALAADVADAADAVTAQEDQARLLAGWVRQGRQTLLSAMGSGVPPDVLQQYRVALEAAFSLLDAQKELQSWLSEAPPDEYGACFPPLLERLTPHQLLERDPTRTQLLVKHARMDVDRLQDRLAFSKPPDAAWHIGSHEVRPTAAIAGKTYLDGSAQVLLCNSLARQTPVSKDADDPALWAAWHAVRHPAVARLYGVLSVDKPQASPPQAPAPAPWKFKKKPLPPVHAWRVTEHLGAQTLDVAIRARTWREIEDKVDVLRQVVRGVLYLHTSVPPLYTDLSPDKIAVMSDKSCKLTELFLDTRELDTVPRFAQLVIQLCVGPPKSFAKLPLALGFAHKRKPVPDLEPESLDQLLKSCLGPQPPPFDEILTQLDDIKLELDPPEDTPGVAEWDDDDDQDDDEDEDDQDDDQDTNEEGEKSTNYYLKKAYRLEYGDGRDKDVSAALNLYRHVMEMGEYDAASRLRMAIHRLADPSVFDEAKLTAKLYKNNYETDPFDLLSTARWALCLVFGIGVDRNEAQAREVLRKASLHKVDHCSESPQILYIFGHALRKINKWESAALWSRAAQLEYAPAQAMLGDCYRRGFGVDQDLKLAVEWFQKASEQGNPFGQNFLANCLQVGHGIEQDEGEAGKLYHLAGKQGLSSAQNSLGAMCVVLKAERKAVQWYSKSAAQGDVLAMNRMAVFHENGVGMPKNQAAANEFYRLAAEHGSTNAQYTIAMNYMSGYGCQQNLEMAEIYFRRAASKGHEHAKRKLDVLRSRGKP